MKRRFPVLTILLTLLLTSPLVAAYDRDDDDDGPRAYVIGSGDGRPSLFSDGNRAYLGVQLEEETEWAEGGARVTRVVDDSPAETAGLQKGDIIVRFNDRTIRGPVALTRAIHDTEPGDAIKLTVVRDGRERRLDLEMGERKGFRVVTPEWNREFSDRMGALGQRLGYAYSCEEGDCSLFGPDCEGDDCGQPLTWSFGGNFDRPTLGVQLVEVTPELRKHLGSADDQGVLVSKVIDGTAAEAAGIRVGDLIVAVDGDEIGNTADLRRALRGKRGETFDVEVLRNSRSVNIEVTIPEPKRDRPTGPRASVERDRDARRAYARAVGQARAAQRESASAERDAARALGRAVREAERSQRRLLRDSI